MNFEVHIQVLRDRARQMLANGKGILAIDESHGTCAKRFEVLNVPCTEETRRSYREMLITAPGLKEALSGMILFDETLRQSASNGEAFVEILRSRGIMPGIKVDTGAHPLALRQGEFVTEGLDALRARLTEYKSLGAVFAKWRAVIVIADDLPSAACIRANSHALARYAALCQEIGLLPIVEPEMLMDGAHSIEKCYEVSARVWSELFSELKLMGVDLSALILKTGMVLPGTDCVEQADTEKIAAFTRNCLRENLPAEIPGVVFLSGGQSAADSTLRLDAMNKMNASDPKGPLPWPLSFSYGRGIQKPALEIWARESQAANDSENTRKAQAVLLKRALMNQMAARGLYDLANDN